MVIYSYFISLQGGRLASSSAGEVLKNVVELERNREVEQDAISSANEKTGPKKGLEDKEVNMSSANEKTNRKRVKRDNQDNILYSDEKKDTKKIEDDKQCNVSSAEEEEDGDSEASWNESSDALDSDKKNSAIGKNDTLPSFEKSSPKLKTFVSISATHWTWLSTIALLYAGVSSLEFTCSKGFKALLCSLT